jgi:antitoxin (DNA-binding transcriptional repressor) of toxin-antitoxin stability system
MPILGNATTVVAKVTRASSNALRVQLTTPDGAELGRAQQKGGAAVLLGFKNGGKSDYTLSGPGGEEFRIAVAGTTTITSQNTPVGRIVPADGAARLEDGGGAVLAVVQPHTGFKADGAWHHRLLSPAGQELGVLTLMTVHTGWKDIEWEAVQLLSNTNIATLKAPSAGALLQLNAPVAPQVGDVLAAACVDFSVLPRGYIAKTQAG